MKQRTFLRFSKTSSNKKASFGLIGKFTMQEVPFILYNFFFLISFHNEMLFSCHLQTRPFSNQGYNKKSQFRPNVPNERLFRFQEINAHGFYGFDTELLIFNEFFCFACICCLFPIFFPVFESISVYL